MEPQLITITEYCVNYDVERDFIISLEESGMITLTILDTEKYIHEEQFKQLDKYVHLYYDLHINIEGVDAIRHLLDKIDQMQNEISNLKGQLNLHQ